jgi:hypothetical protein
MGPVIGIPRRARRSPDRRCRPRANPTESRNARGRGGAGSPGPAVLLAGSWRADRGRSRRCVSARPGRPAPQILHCPGRGGHAGVASAGRPRSARPDARRTRHSQPAIPRPRWSRRSARPSARCGAGGEVLGSNAGPSRPGPCRRDRRAHREQVVVGLVSQLPVHRDRTVRGEPGGRDLGEDRRGLGHVGRTAPGLRERPPRPRQTFRLGDRGHARGEQVLALRPGRPGRLVEAERRRIVEARPRRPIVRPAALSCGGRPGAVVLADRRLRDDGQRCRVSAWSRARRRLARRHRRAGA